MSDEHLRIGDAEREQAAAVLGEHYAQGRITTEEHAERLDQIWAARTRAGLQPVFRDLPTPRRPEARRTPRAWRGPSPKLLLAVLAALIVLTVLTHVPFVLAGLLVALFVLSRRRHRTAGNPHAMRHWSR
jgi:hypothetical protein